eukprot:TRINITY_DN9357_c0_g1_i3.p1 TRINITY_DN9357_c0_g1~~TRINITY_DN9357_c0_g1_i3.p1  ORF type:complete len:264 (+),score=42.22 TRINITY_DN9357_c0_g1_i3:133-924(+)
MCIRDSSRTVDSTSPVENSCFFLVCMFFMIFSCSSGAGSLMVVYLKSDRYQLGDVQIGWFTSAQYLMKWFVLVGVVPPIRRMCGKCAEVGLIRAGGVVAVVAITGYILAPSAWVLFAAAMAEAGDVVVIPALRALLSIMAAEEEQGTVLAVVANLETLANALVPLISGQVYSHVGHQTAFMVLVLLGIWYCLFSLRLRTRGITVDVRSSYNWHCPQDNCKLTRGTYSFSFSSELTHDEVKPHDEFKPQVDSMVDRSHKPDPEA